MSIDALARMLVPLRGEDRTIGQAVIREWDPDTFESVVEYDGLMLENLPVGSGLEALTYRSGDVVLIEGAFPGGRKGELGLGSYFIARRIITPGTGAAEQAIAFMQTSLAKSLSAQIFAERIHVADGWGLGATSNSITWSDGGLGNDNPVLTNIEITDAGFALVIVTGEQIIDNVHATVPDGLMGAQMSVQITGATTVSPDVFGGGASLENRHKLLGSTSGDWQSIFGGSMVVPQVLNPGLNTFTAQYRSVFGGNTIVVANPSIVVIGF